MRKDSLIPKVEWAKHLRPFGKRRQAKAERQATKSLINDDAPKNKKKGNKGRKKWGIKYYWDRGTNPFASLPFSSNEGAYYQWYSTEKGRDDAYRNWELKLKEYEKAKKTKELTSFIYIDGNRAEKVKR